MIVTPVRSPKGYTLPNILPSKLLSRRHCPELRTGLHALLPLITATGGAKAAGEMFHALRDVAQWCHRQTGVMLYHPRSVSFIAANLVGTQPL